MTTTTSPIINKKLISLIATESLMISSKATAKQAIAMMGETGSSYVLVMEGLGEYDEKQNLIGILTARDVVRLSMQSHDLEQLSIQEVMSHPVITIQKSIADNINATLNLFQQYHICHLPVLDGDRLIGLLFKDVLTDLLAQTALNTSNSEQKIIQECDLRYLSLAAASPVAIFRFDKQFNCIYVNDRWSEMTGRSPESALGNGWKNALHPDDLHHLVSQWERHYNQVDLSNPVIINSEGRHLRPDGSINWFYVQLVQEINDKNQITGFIGTLMDITARKQAELDLQKNEQRYRALMDGASDAILLASPQGNLIEANQKAEELLGYSRDDLKRLHVSQIHPPEAIAAVQNHFKSVMQNNFASAMESLVLRKDGNQIPVEITASCIELDGERIVQGIFRDIRDRKHSEIALWKANQELNYHIENSPLATITWDQEFRTRRWSARAEEIFGWKSEEVLGKTFFDWKFIYEPDIPTVQQVAAQILRDGKASCHNRNYRKDGSIIYCDWYNSVLLDEAGNLVSMTSLVQDVSERKRTEAALFDTKKRYQALFNHKTDAVFINSFTDTGKPSAFIEVNDAACASLGYSREELLTMTPSDIIPKEFFCDRAAMEKLRTQKYASSEVLHQTKDGRIFPVELSLVELGDNEAKPLIIASARDISDRKQAELALQESQHFIRKIADASPNILYLYDIQKQQNIYSNREVFSILGYSPDEIKELGDNFAINLMHPDDLRLVYPAYYDKIRTAQDGEIIENEYRMRHANGKWHWLYSRDSVFSRDEHGLVKQIIGTAQDITERKNLEQTQKRLIAILEASTDYISMSDAKGNIFWKNAELKRLCGIDPHKDVLQFRLVNCHPQWAVDLIEQQAIPSAIANGSWLGETALLDAEGREILVSQLLLVHKSPQGEIEFFSSIMRDMRVYKEYEQQLERTNANLIRATSLKDEFLASMSHELRTPLNAILGMAEALQDDIFGAVNERQLKALQTIERSGVHLLELINDILDVSKIESGQMNLDFGFTNVNALCQSSIAFVKQQALQKNILIDERISQNLPDLWVDERRIRQVLINLLNNAVKFTAEGGRITLEVTQFSLNPVPNAAIAKNFLRIAVIDTGIGIAPENIHKLFQPFVQIDSALNRKYAGTGLGLSLVKRVVELHGGEVGLTSELGVGSCFMIDLPYVSVASQPDAAIDVTPSDMLLDAAIAPSDAPLVLLAEDNEANIATISSYLTAKDYRVVLAKNGQEAIALAKSHPPDIILMDIQMPIMDGLEATKQIRLEPDLAKIPIIALTALAMTGDLEKCLGAGANDYLTKPVKLKQLVKTIQHFLG